jgi:ribosomal protein L32
LDDDKPLRDPARKKALSYARDRRNRFGQNDKAARKAIPARKAGESRKSRRKAGHALKVIEVIERADEASATLSESSLAHDIERVGGWTKGPDTPLGEVVHRNAKARIERDGRKSRASAFSTRSVSAETVTEFTALLSNRDNLSKKRRWRELRRLLKGRVRRELD